MLMEDFYLNEKKRENEVKNLCSDQNFKSLSQNTNVQEFFVSIEFIIKRMVSFDYITQNMQARIEGKKLPKTKKEEIKQFLHL